MTLIWLGVLLVFVGVLQMAFQPMWRGRLSGTKRLRSGRDTPGLKDRVAASASNRIGLDSSWSRLAALSCWPQLPSELKRTSLLPSGVALHLVPVVNQIRTYWWCSPPRTGRQRMVPASLTARETGASFSKDKCVLISL